jgi:transposase InsO family protein
MDSCAEFARLGVQAKWDIVKDHKLCFMCLGKHCHTSKCRAPRCNIDDCTGRHHRSLHATRTPATPADELRERVFHVTQEVGAVALKVLPVKLSGPKGAVDTYALLDDGSTVTLIEEKIADAIGARGPRAGIRITGAAGICASDSGSRCVKLTIQGDAAAYEASAYTVKALKLPAHIMNGKKNTSSSTEVRPQILIGLDNARLIVQRGNAEFRSDGLIVSETPLGRVTFGGGVCQKDATTPLMDQGSEMNKESGQCGEERTVMLNIGRPSRDDALEALVKFNFALEAIGVATTPRVNAAEKRALTIMNETTKQLTTGRWETGLIWSDDESTLPNNKEAAEKRLYSLEKKLSKDPVLEIAYRAKINEYVAKGYAIELSRSEEAQESARKWYLPHFAVRNQNKPDKIRVVFDAANRHRGVCLNDRLLTGPDLLTSLVGGIQRFREGGVAIAADIKEMFLRIQMTPSDQMSQLFLWRNGPSEDMRTFALTSMMFGARCSPSSAQFVRNKVASAGADKFPEAALAVQEKMYMDDYLDAVDTTEEAARLLRDVTTLLSSGGFELTGWASNNLKVLRSVEDKDRAKSAIIIGENATTERVLGVHWDPHVDLFVFRYQGEITSAPDWPTKRQLLSEVMKIFDPMGFIGCVTIRGRILLQAVWRSSIGWDEALREEHAQKLGEFRRLLNENSCAIPRCCVNLKREEVTMHLFSDASEQACCAVAYFVHRAGTSFIMSKSKVAPLKPLSVPRLELQAALLAARLAASIKKESRVKITNTVFWTDSSTVLCWLRNDPLTYSTFVANRLGEIDEIAGTSGWRWVPTKMNPADVGTRDTQPPDMSTSGIWFRGPEFLSWPESEWPQEKKVVAPPDDWLETKPPRYFVGHCNVIRGLPDVSRFSSWMRLLRTTAWVVRFIDRCRKRPFERSPGGDFGLRAEEVKRAEKIWTKLSQQRSFGGEMEALRRGEPLPRDGRLQAVTPVIDEDGVLRMDSRLRTSEYGAEAPMILDAKDEYVKLMIKHQHSATGHPGPERTVGDLRARFYIVRLRTTLRQIVRSCRVCRMLRSAPQPPLMGQLPEARLARTKRPFTHCGLDFFGPMTVKIGRRREKRYGALFTCMTTRAVHIELAHSLSSDSAILALRRMFAKRGPPTVMYTDNGTNFHGADRELKAAVKELKKDELLLNAITTRGIEWKFIPPSSPHMGGAWERLVRSVKRALNATLKERAPREETLLTALAEAEYSINSRPLTHVSVDPKDDEPLTPNHFLIGSAGGLQPLARYDEANEDIRLTKQWRESQQLADMFWRRWLKEYLPSLANRQKWRTPVEPVREGDLVLVTDPRQPRNTWPRGRVIKATPAADGQVRVVQIQTASGTYTRPVVRLAVFPREEQ